MGQKGFALNFVLVGILVIAAILGGVYYLRTPKSVTVPQQQAEISGDYDVVIKENPENSAKSDIYLKDKSGQETFFITLDEVYKHHNHPAEFHQGNLYIIQRTGGEDGYQDITDWTDQLWKYDSSKEGMNLYSSRGLDFRVSNDDKLIAIVGSGPDETEILVFTDTLGNVRQEFNVDVNGVINPLIWGQNSFWFVAIVPPYPVAFIKVETDSFELIEFDVEDVGIGMEYIINPDIQKLAYSDYPPLFDEDSANEYKASGKKVTLYIYDLETDEKKIINTSVTKKFNPTWIDERTLEYDNPQGEGRMKKKI